VEPAATEHVEPATTGNSVAAAGAGLPGGPPALSAGTGAADADPVKALARLGILATDAYQPGAALREHIITRDVTCRFPTCRQPGRRCQIDHIPPFDPAKPAWAQTHQGNLHLLCARHHQLKTTGTWHVRRDYPTGDTQWTSPLGYHHTRP